MSTDKRRRQRHNREVGRSLEQEVRAQVRAEATELGYQPDSDDPAEKQAYLLLLACMEKHEMTVAEADKYLEWLFANQADAEIVPIGGRE